MMFIGLIISSSIALHAVDVHNLTTLKHTASSAFSAAAVRVRWRIFMCATLT